jgi:hypothetical protein
MKKQDINTLLKFTLPFMLKFFSKDIANELEYCIYICFYKLLNQHAAILNSFI